MCVACANTTKTKECLGAGVAAFEVPQQGLLRTSIVRILPHYPLDCGRPGQAGLSDVQRDIATCGTFRTSRLAKTKQDTHSGHTSIKIRQHNDEFTC